MWKKGLMAAGRQRNANLRSLRPNGHNRRESSHEQLTSMLNNPVLGLLLAMLGSSFFGIGPRPTPASSNDFQFMQTHHRNLISLCRTFQQQLLDFAHHHRGSGGDGSQQRPICMQQSCNGFLERFIGTNGLYSPPMTADPGLSSSNWHLFLT
jgi:hypothetical protein